MKAYLLGRLNEKDEEEIEVRLMTDPAFAEEFDMTVMEMTDQYVAGKFEGEERERMERHFFQAAVRRAKLNIALGLKQQQTKRPRRTGSKFRSAVPIAATLIIFAGVSYTLYLLTRPSELNRGLTALRAATQDRRPVRARISGLDYAPFQQNRGAENNTQDQNLRLAELNLKAALNDNPTPEVHHALGQVYLASGQFDAAITHLNQALAGTQANARIYSDLGAAWLEKGKLLLQPGSNDRAPRAKQEFAQSLENLNKALQLDSNLVEALFNRALVYDYQGQTEQAKRNWQEYLKRDSTSQWAAEAQRNLQVIESGS